MPHDAELAADGAALPVRAGGADWLTSWHPPTDVPEGRRHGACGFCVTSAGEVVLISQDGHRWGWPGGRPEDGETWEQTFRREMQEETCCEVREARVLGFCRSECLSGHEAGLVLVRSVWRGQVELAPWAPKFEVAHRRLVPAALLLSTIHIDPGWEPIFRRAAREAELA